MHRVLKTVRFRLTAWYCLVHLVVLGLFGVLVYGTVRHELVQHHDGALRRAAASVVSVLSEHDDCAHLTPTQVDDLDGLAHLVLVHEMGGRGEVFYESPDSASWLPARSGSTDGKAVQGFETVETKRGPVRVFKLPYQPRSGREGLIRVMEPLGDVAEPLHAFRRALFLMTPLALLVSFLGGYWLAGRALRPVDSLTVLAREISASNLTRRLPESGVDDELGRLVHVFNEMIRRLEASFEGMKRFTSDAAHELRSPLANLRSTVDVTLGRDRDPSVYREALSSVREEVERLRSIIEDLLVLARADAGKLRLDRERVRLDQLAEDVVDSFEERAKELDVRLCLIEGDAVSAWGDERWLRQVASNLVDNALKFTATQPAGSLRLVEVEVLSDGDIGVVRVADTGPGLPPEAREHVFERFFRADPSRTRSVTDGFGLGLSIAASIIQAIGGRITVTERSAGGAEFTMRLPRITA